jgi:hypothetical protein
MNLGTRHVKYGIEIDHEQTQECCMNGPLVYSLAITNVGFSGERSGLAKSAQPDV